MRAWNGRVELPEVTRHRRGAFLYRSRTTDSHDLSPWSDILDFTGLLPEKRDVSHLANTHRALTTVTMVMHRCVPRLPPQTPPVDQRCNVPNDSKVEIRVIAL